MALKKLDRIVNNWTIQKRPHTFAERSAFEATAVDADGYLTAREGFSTLREAVAYCKINTAPSNGRKEAKDAQCPIKE